MHEKLYDNPFTYVREKENVSFFCVTKNNNFDRKKFYSETPVPPYRDDPFILKNENYLNIILAKDNSYKSTTADCKNSKIDNISS